MKPLERETGCDNQGNNPGHNEKFIIAEKFWDTIEKFGFGGDDIPQPIVHQDGCRLSFLQPTVLDTEEYQRILKSISNDQVSERESVQQMMTKDRWERHLASIQRTANWTDTREYRKKEQLEARQKRIDEEEKKQVLIDEAWALVIEQERQQTLQRSNLLRFLGTDEGFQNSSKLLEEQVNRERKLQIEYRKQQKQRQDEMIRNIESEILEKAEHDIIEEAKQRQKEKEGRYKNASDLILAKFEKERIRTEDRMKKKLEEAYVAIDSFKYLEDVKLEKNMKREKEIRLTRNAIEDVLKQKRVDSDQRSKEEQSLMTRISKFQKDQEYLHHMRKEHDRQLREKHDAVIKQRQMLVADMKEKSARQRDEDLRKLENFDFLGRFDGYERQKEKVLSRIAK